MLILWSASSVVCTMSFTLTMPFLMESGGLMLDASCPTELLYNPPSSSGQGRENIRKSGGSRQGHGEITHLLPLQATQTLFEGNQFTLLPTRSE